MTAADRLSKSTIKKIGIRNGFLFSNFISIPLSRFLFIIYGPACSGLGVQLNNKINSAPSGTCSDY